MPTDCSADLFEFAPVEGRKVVAAFDAGPVTSDAGALLLGATDRAIRHKSEYEGPPDRSMRRLAALKLHRVVKYFPRPI